MLLVIAVQLAVVRSVRGALLLVLALRVESELVLGQAATLLLVCLSAARLAFRAPLPAAAGRVPGFVRG